LKLALQRRALLQDPGRLLMGIDPLLGQANPFLVPGF